MRAVIQRVCEASCTVDNELISKIDSGLLVLLGVEDADTDADLDYIVKKISNMRIFSDEAGKMNLSVQDISGKILLISQFTLFADTKKGNRPSFTKSGKPDFANEMYEKTYNDFRKMGIMTLKGIFGADMKIGLINDGPVTIIIDSKER